MAIDFEKVSALCVDDQSSYPELSMGGEWRVRKKAVEVMRIDVYICIYIYLFMYTYIYIINIQFNALADHNHQHKNVPYDHNQHPTIHQDNPS
jgi:hypothetical protein